MSLDQSGAIAGRDPAPYNLPARINWLTIQVGNYSGRPTAAQTEWIDRYADQTDAVIKQLETIRTVSLQQLNAKLKAGGLPEIAAGRRGSM
jgi:hypothetical protein